MATHNSNPLITVAICTRNRAPLLEKAVSSVLSQITDDEELLIVDNGSNDNTPILAALFTGADSRVKVIQELQAGLSMARNLALQQAQGEWVIFLDDDAIAESGWLAAYKDFFLHLPSARVACTGGPVTPFHDGQSPAWLGTNAYRLAGVNECRPFPPKGSPMGCNYAVRREAALAAGAFNTSLGRSGKFLGAHEEIELTERFRRAGYEVWWVPRAGIRHLVTLRQLRLRSQLHYAFGDGRSRAVRYWNKSSGFHRAILVVGRIVIAPFHCGINLLMALTSFPFQKGRMAMRALVQAGSIAGMTFQLILQIFRRP
ncbi:MAG: glycosyltransferase [Verrucomicrobiota bacterium]|jgi:glycosyltransferase involved in cell wall biosynthesis